MRKPVPYKYALRGHPSTVRSRLIGGGERWVRRIAADVSASRGGNRADSTLAVPNSSPPRRKFAIEALPKLAGGPRVSASPGRGDGPRLRSPEAWWTAPGLVVESATPKKLEIKIPLWGQDRTRVAGPPDTILCDQLFVRTRHVWMAENGGGNIYKRGLVQHALPTCRREGQRGLRTDVQRARPTANLLDTLLTLLP